MAMDQVTKEIILRKSRKSNIYIVIHHIAIPHCLIGRMGVRNE